MDGRETIQLRGYNNSLTPVDERGDQIGATVINKFSMELRYPITKASASLCISIFRSRFV
jgi:outer membrane protein insertion porin family